MTKLTHDKEGLFNKLGMKKIYTHIYIYICLFLFIIIYFTPYIKIAFTLVVDLNVKQQAPRKNKQENTIMILGQVRIFKIRYKNPQRKILIYQTSLKSRTSVLRRHPPKCERKTKDKRQYTEYIKK